MTKKLFFIIVSLGLFFGTLMLSRVSSTVDPTFAQIQSSDWPQLQHDAQKSGFQPNMRIKTAVSAPNGYKTPLWTFSVSDQDFVGQPIASNGVVAIAAKSGLVYILDEQTGRLLYRIDAGSPVANTLAIANGSVIVATVRGTISAYSLSTGQLLWKQQPSKRSYIASPTIAGDLLYIGGSDGVMRAIKVSDGTQIWAFVAGGITDVGSLPAPIVSSAAVLGSTVYVGAENMTVYALNRETGSLLWKRKITGESFLTIGTVASSRGMAFASGWLVASAQNGGIVMARTSPIYTFHDELNSDESYLSQVTGEDVNQHPEGNLAKWIVEQKAISERLANNPHRRTLWELDAGSGKDKFSSALPILYTSGTGSVPTAPVVDDTRGRAWVMARSIYARIDGIGVRNYGDLVKLNLSFDPRVYTSATPSESLLGMQFFPCNSAPLGCRVNNDNLHKISDEGEVMTGVSNAIVSSNWVADGAYDLESQKIFNIRSYSSDDTGSAAVYGGSAGVIFANGRVITKDTLGIHSFSAQ